MNNKNALFFVFSFLLLILSILISPKVSHASTIVDQDIITNTTWTALSSPYLIEADVTVDDFTTLTIEPGTIIKFDYGYNIFVDGSVVAVGTTLNPITVTSIADDTIGGDSNNDGNLSEPGVSDYGGLVFSFLSAGNFAYTNFKYANTAIAGSPDDLTITNSNFTQNNLPLLIDYATNFTHSGNTITGNYINGIGLSGTSFMTDVHLTGGDGTYLLYDTLTIDDGYTLTLDAGVVLKNAVSYQNTSIYIYGQMQSLGTALEPVCITTLDDDSCGGDTLNDGLSADPSYGGFHSIYFNSINNVNSQLIYTNIKYIKGNSGIYVDGANLSVSHSNFIGKYSTLYFYQSSGSTILDSTFTNLLNAAVDVSFDSTATITNTTFDMNGNNVNVIDIYQDSYIDIYDSIISNGHDGVSISNGGNMLMLNTIIENMTSDGIGMFNNSNNNVSIVAISDSEIKNCYDGLYISDFVNLDFTNNKVHGNIFGAFKGGVDDVTLINNYWGSDTGPTHASNPNGTGDEVSDRIIFSPWTILNPNPPTYYAKITNAPGDIGKMYETPTTSGILIKTLPNDWVVQIINQFDLTNTTSPVIADGYRWFQIKDPTDGSTGWMISNLSTDSTPTFLPYVDTEQVDDEYISSFKFDKPVVGGVPNDPDYLIHRRQAILDAVNNYFTNSSTTKSLYSADDDSTYLISKLISVATFPQELVLAIAAHEAGASLNNEFVSYDYGYGIMQITPNNYAHEKPGKNYTDNSIDPRGILSDIHLDKCKTIILNSLGQYVTGTDQYKKCHQNTNDFNTKVKPYSFYDHIQTNSKYKQYSNTVQSIYANIKDGLGVLRQKHLAVVGKACASGTYEGIVFTCNDIKKIKTVWGYNGYGTDKNTHLYNGHYLQKISTTLDSLSTYFPGHNYANTDQLIQKLAIADAHKEEIRPHTLQAMKVIDSKGNITGMDNGIVKNDIPNSYYDKDTGATLILFPKDNYTYEVVGDVNIRTYGFDVVDTKNGEDKEILNVNDVKIDKGEIHKYNYSGKEYIKSVIIDKVNITNQ